MKTVEYRVDNQLLAGVKFFGNEKAALWVAFPVPTEQDLRTLFDGLLEQGFSLPEAEEGDPTSGSYLSDDGMQAVVEGNGLPDERAIFALLVIARTAVEAIYGECPPPVIVHQ